MVIVVFGHDFDDASEYDLDVAVVVDGLVRDGAPMHAVDVDPSAGDPLGASDEDDAAEDEEAGAAVVQARDLEGHGAGHDDIDEDDDEDVNDKTDHEETETMKLTRDSGLAWSLFSFLKAGTCCPMVLNITITEDMVGPRARHTVTQADSHTGVDSLPGLLQSPVWSLAPVAQQGWCSGSQVARLLGWEGGAVHCTTLHYTVHHCTALIDMAGVPNAIWTSCDLCVMAPAISFTKTLSSNLLKLDSFWNLPYLASS